MLNPGDYSKKISIYKVAIKDDSAGFKNPEDTLVLTTWAKVKTTKGFTLIASNSDFEKAYTNFTIRYSQTVENAYYNAQNSNRDMIIVFRNKRYKIEYLNNIDEECVELELQAKEILK